jgi:hypothetical protein
MVTHPLTNWLPASLAGVLRLDRPATRWGGAEMAELNVRGALPDARALFQTNLAWPERLAALDLDADGVFRRPAAPQLAIERAAVIVGWTAPHLNLDAAADFGGGALDMQAVVNATTREVSCEGTTSFDPLAIAPLLGTNTQRWLANYSWEAPPVVQGQGRLVLPAWTNRQPDWRGEVLPTLSVRGWFEVGEGAYRGVPFRAAQAGFSFTNTTWRLAGLRLSRPEGEIVADYESDQRTRDFHWTLRGAFAPQALRPLFPDEKQQRAFDYVRFTAPPVVQGEVWGRWGEDERLGVAAHVAATNFTIRGERVDACVTRVTYTNRFLACLEPRMWRDGRHGQADGIGIDFPALKLWLTNTAGDLDPYAVTRAIGPQTARALAPYRFAEPPRVSLSGAVDLKRKRYEEDLRFRVDGGAFQWGPFNLRQLAGDVHWRGQTLQLTNVAGEFYGGRITGHAAFDFARTNGAEFGFFLTVTNADLGRLVADVSTRSNKLAGELSGELAVMRANAADYRSWQGYGQVRLRDGLIWDTPVFGLFSPVLNALVPGAGNSRAKHASAEFTITNSVIHTKDLQIHATASRLDFEGTVDFDQRVDGRMEARLLRDVPGVGLFFSVTLFPLTKLFEYKVTGTLNQPEARPLYTISKVLLLPFHPIRTLKDLFTPDEPRTPGGGKKPDKAE